MRAGKIFITDLKELGLLDRVRGFRPIIFPDIEPCLAPGQHSQDSAVSTKSPSGPQLANMRCN